MAAERNPKSNSERVSAYRKRLREQGLRPVQFWLPDVTSPEFIARARREAQAVAASPGEKDNIDFVESISELLEE